MRRRGLQRRGERNARDVAVLRREQLVRPLLNPLRDVGVGRAAVRRVVLEAAVLRRVVRRSDHDAVGQVRCAAAVVHQDRAGDDRRRREPAVALDDRVDAVAGQHFERDVLRQRRQGVRVLAHVERAVDRLAAAVVADRLRDRGDVRGGQAAVERRAAMAARAEFDPLARVVEIGRAIEKLRSSVATSIRRAGGAGFPASGCSAMTATSVCPGHNICEPERQYLTSRLRRRIAPDLLVLKCGSLTRTP